MSLAIYINGVVQEFLHLVRATAPNAPSPGGEPPLLNGDGAEVGPRRSTGSSASSLASATASRPGKTSPGDPIRTRFVVDVLSGSSAGGINGDLPRQGARHELEIDALKQALGRGGRHRRRSSTTSGRSRALLGLALDEAADLAPEQPAHVLEDPQGARRHGRRRRATAAARLADSWTSSTSGSTMTDIGGLQLPIDLIDSVVFESADTRHVLALPLRDADAAGGEQTRNDFGAASTRCSRSPARCTSSFPFAFEPMLLDDIDWAVDARQFEGRYRDAAAPMPTGLRSSTRSSAAAALALPGGPSRPVSVASRSATAATSTTSRSRGRPPPSPGAAPTCPSTAADLHRARSRRRPAAVQRQAALPAPAVAPVQEGGVIPNVIAAAPQAAAGGDDPRGPRAPARAQPRDRPDPRHRRPRRRARPRPTARCQAVALHSEDGAPGGTGPAVCGLPPAQDRRRTRRAG